MRPITAAAAITLSLSLLACNSAEKKAAEAQEQQRQLAEKTGLIRDKDNLETAVAEYASMVNELDSVLRNPNEGRKGDVVDDRQRRRELLRKARTLRQSLDSMGTRIQQLESEARKSGTVSAARLADIAALKVTVNSLTQITDRQKTEIARMSLQIDSVTQVSQANERHAVTLQAALTENVEKQESVFVAVGTSDELKRRGIVRNRGGVIGMGGTLVPILPFKSELFKPLRMSADTLIEFPNASATYRVITGQNPDGAQGAALSHLNGKLAIHNPKLFWRDSRYLVIVQR